MKKAILLLILSGCGPNPLEVKFVEEDIKEHVRVFSQLYNNEVNIEIRYAKLSLNVVGLCYSYSDGVNRIEIDKEEYESYSYYGKQQLIFHELGHCVLNRDHVSTKFNWRGVEIPTSVMYPFAFGNFVYYNMNMTHYHDELIRGK